MNILLVAPQPFYQERGTPIAVDLLIRSLTEQNHHIDLLTFSEGEDRHFDKVRHIRIRAWFGLKQIKPGFSLKKIILDFFLFFKMILLMYQNRYDVVHAVEESVFMAFVLCPLFGVKYIYDMDSSMSTQIVDKLPTSIKKVEPILNYFESLPMRYATTVVPVCDALASIVYQYRKEGVFILKDVSLADKSAGPLGSIDIRKSIGKGKKIAMYIGNLESYQGVDLMLESFALASIKKDQLALAIIGGEPEHIDSYKKICEESGISNSTYFFGKHPVAHLFEIMEQADVLISPRIHGVNTPMKVYSYMDSGVPVLATKLPTHTQVMTDKTALLVDATPKAMAAGLNELLNNPEKCRHLAMHASEYIKQEHSLKAFKTKLRDIYDYISEHK